MTPVGIDARYCPAELVAAAQSKATGCSKRAKHGYRNAQVTVIAPTGTIGLVMDCDTTGIEPDFALVKFKKLAGAGTSRSSTNRCRRRRPSWATPSGRSTTSSALQGGRDAPGLSAREPRARSRPRVHGRGDPQDRGATPRGVQAAVRVQQVDGGEDFSRHAQDLRRDPRRADLRPAHPSRLQPPAGERGEPLRLRHDDHRRARTTSRSTTRSSTAPTAAARPASGSCRGSRTSA